MFLLPSAAVWVGVRICSFIFSLEHFGSKLNQSLETLHNSRESNPELVKWHHCSLGTVCVRVTIPVNVGGTRLVRT